MPHIIAEYTPDIKDMDGLLGRLHDSLASQETVQKDALKSRAAPLSYVMIGDGKQSSMIHITVRLLSGRSDALLNKMAADLHKVAKDHVGSATSVTVETVNLYNPSYQK